jgi:EAL domain-containing protein (putative c-di-GMP-specific phosphodiesterase class I)
MLPPDELAAGLRDAVNQENLFAVFQPLIDIETGQIVGVEALCRWRQANGELVPPDAFIPVAEATGLIHQVGRFMLDECLAVADHWHAMGTPIEVSVNVSPQQLAEDSFTAYLVQQLDIRDLPLNTLTIEITESLPMTDLGAIVPRLRALLNLGVGVSLDDYGTGHASAERLGTIPVTELKLDRSLIQSDSRRTMRSLENAVGQAKERGLRIVAEGVETPAHLELARELECDRAQGYLLGLPMRAWDVDTLLAG